MRVIFPAEQVENGVTMWSFTCWRDGEIERDPKLRAARALKELEGWPEDVRHGSHDADLAFLFVKYYLLLVVNFSGAKHHRSSMHMMTDPYV